MRLTGIKVIDASSVLAGPSVGTFFAELGAEVIKVEHPTHPDVTRSWKLPTEDPFSESSAYFASINYGKSYVKLNLAQSEDRSAFNDLIQDADIVLMNFKRTDYIKFQLTEEALRALNPRLIVGKISGYGSDSDRVAYDLILQAESGFMSMNGQPDGPPTKMPVALIDVLAAHHLKEGILLALYEREKTNQGQSVEVSLYDAAISSLVNQASNYLMGDAIPQRIGSKHPNIAPYGELFETKDEKTITFAIGSDLHFEKLCSVLKLDALLADARFQHNQQRVKNRIPLAAFIQEKVAHWESEPLLGTLESLNVPAGEVKNLAAVFSDQKAKRLIREEDQHGVQTKRITSVVFNHGN